jgi:hypothetical protein
MRWEGEANEGGKFLKALTNAANSLYRSDLVVPQVHFLFCFRKPFVEGIHGLRIFECSSRVDLIPATITYNSRGAPHACIHVHIQHTCPRAQTRIRTQVLEEGEVVIIDTHRVLWGKVPVADNADVLR